MARKAPPKLEYVLAALREGRRFQIGCGRSYVSYFMDGETIKREIFDEGHTEIQDVSEAVLEGAIQYNPDQFDRV